MRNGLVILTLTATLFTAGCIRYVKDGTYSGFKHPLPAGIEYCLGESTLSPQEDRTLKDYEAFQCAEHLYQWAQTDCSQGNYLMAEKLCDEALQNLAILPDDKKRSDQYETLKNHIDNLKVGIKLHHHCR